MTKRRMEGQELTFAIKSLENKKGEKDWLNYQLDYHDLMLKTGLDMNHLKNVRDFKDKKREYGGELKVVEEVIKILQSQIRNGVEEKKDEDKIEKEDK